MKTIEDWEKETIPSHSLGTCDFSGSASLTAVAGLWGALNPQFCCYQIAVVPLILVITQSHVNIVDCCCILQGRLVKYFALY